MDSFELQSDYKPTGDQPAAIEQLTNGINAGLQNQTLLGVTGSGKTFTLANVIQKTQKPTSGFKPQQDPCRPAVRRVQEVLS